MKRSYRKAQLIEYGPLTALTLGAGGTLPDFLGNQLVNATCPTQTFLHGEQAISRTACANTIASIDSGHH
jgi:hypothetical protein